MYLCFRFRSVIKPPTDETARCPITEDTKVCNQKPCNLQDKELAEESEVGCEVTTWSPWSMCSKTCGSGIMHRFRVIVKKPKNGGKQCGNLEENKPCDAGFCYGLCCYVLIN